jgi:hypothetical protein
MSGREGGGAVCVCVLGGRVCFCCTRGGRGGRDVVGGVVVLC